MLAVVHLRAGPVTGAGCDGERQIAEAQHVAVDSQVSNVVVRTQHRQHNPAIAELPVDIEERCVCR